MHSFLQCLKRRSKATNSPRLSEDDTTRSVHSFIEILFVSKKGGMDLRLALDGIVETDYWKRDSAGAVLRLCKSDPDRTSNERPSLGHPQEGHRYP